MVSAQQELEDEMRSAIAKRADRYHTDERDWRVILQSTSGATRTPEQDWGALELNELTYVQVEGIEWSGTLGAMCQPINSERNTTCF